MNPVPTDSQWLVLYQIDEGDVVVDGTGRWKAKGTVGWFSVTGAVQRLWTLRLVDLDKNGKPMITPEGAEVLKRRSVYEVLERVNRRKSSRG